MTKTKKEVVDGVETEIVETAISPITTDFSRTDLNELRDKVNEIISSL